MVLPRWPIVAAVIIFIGALSPALGQEGNDLRPTDKGLNWWVDLGYGLGTTGSSGTTLGIGGGASLQIAPSMLVTARSSYVKQLQICLFAPCDAPSAYAADVAALCGLISKGEMGHVSIAAGAAMVFYRSVDYDEDTPIIRSGTTLGLPIEAQVMFTPIPYLGIGVLGVGNVNFESTFGGMFLAVQVGNAR